MLLRHCAGLSRFCFLGECGLWGFACIRFGVFIDFVGEVVSWGFVGFNERGILSGFGGWFCG